MITDLIVKAWEHTTHNLTSNNSNNNDLEEERRVVVRRSSRPLELDLDDTSSLCEIEQQQLSSNNDRLYCDSDVTNIYQNNGSAAGVATTVGDDDVGHEQNGGMESPLLPPLLPRGSIQQNQLEQYDLTCKVMLLGDSGVGKTCLLVRFRDGIFLSGNYITTVGIDFRNKIIDLDGSKVKLQIWDTAGQERFRSVTHAYYRDAHALLLLYDVTNKTSFDNIRAWLGEIREYAQDDVVIMLLGNKADCGSERVVRKEDGARLAKEYNVAFMETSAKSGLNVESAFLTIARQLKNKSSGNLDESRFNIQDYVRDQTQRVTCPPCNT